MKQGLLALLAGYKRWISPSLPNACRFVPTCSEYAMEAVERHGAFRGSLLAAWRLLRCNPLARSGYDPVPTTPVGGSSIMSFEGNSIMSVERAQPQLCRAGP